MLPDSHFRQPVGNRESIAESEPIASANKLGLMRSSKTRRLYRTQIRKVPRNAAYAERPINGQIKSNSRR